MTTTKTDLPDRLFTTILNNGGDDYIARTAATEEAMFVFGSLLDLVEETEATELGVIRAEHHGSGLMMWVSDEGGMRGLIGVAAKADSSAPMWRLLHQVPPKGMKLRSNPATPPAVPPHSGTKHLARDHNGPTRQHRYAACSPTSARRSNAPDPTSVIGGERESFRSPGRRRVDPSASAPHQPRPAQPRRGFSFSAASASVLSSRNRYDRAGELRRQAVRITVNRLHPEHGVAV